MSRKNNCSEYENIGKQNSHPYDQMIFSNGTWMSGRNYYQGCFQYEDPYGRVHKFKTPVLTPSSPSDLSEYKKFFFDTLPPWLNMADTFFDSLHAFVSKATSLPSDIAQNSRLLVELERIKSIHNKAVRRINLTNLEKKFGDFARSYQHVQINFKEIIPKSIQINNLIDKVKSLDKGLNFISKATGPWREMFGQLEKLGDFFKSAGKVSVLAVLDIVLKIFKTISAYDANKSFSANTSSTAKDGFLFCIVSLCIAIVLTLGAIILMAAGTIGIIFAVIAIGIGFLGAVYEAVTGDDIVTQSVIDAGNAIAEATTDGYSAISKWASEFSLKKTIINKLWEMENGIRRLYRIPY